MKAKVNISILLFCLCLTLPALKAQNKNGHTTLSELAHQQEQEKQYSDAVRTYKAIIHQKDSIAFFRSKTQVERLLTNYDSHLQAIETANRQNTQLWILFALFILANAIGISILTRSLQTYLRQRDKELKLRLETQQAIRQNESRRQLLNDISYHIRTPLNSVIGFSELLAESTMIEAEDKQTYSNIIQRKSEEVLQLVDNVLTLSRLEADMVKWHMEECDWITLCRDVIFKAKQLEGNPIEYSFFPPPDSIMIVADIAQMSKVLLSMITYSTLQESKLMRTVEIKFIIREGMLRCLILNSPLADPEVRNQETMLLSEINRLFFKHFNCYYSEESNQRRQAISFTYPIMPTT